MASMTKKSRKRWPESRMSLVPPILLTRDTVKTRTLANSLRPMMATIKSQVMNMRPTIVKI